MKKKNIIISIIILVLILSIAYAQVEFTVSDRLVLEVFNPFSFQDDLIRSANFSGENITADNFIGNGSPLTGISGFVNSTAWNRTGSNVILANQNDNVGIGTASPTAPLDVNGDMVLSGGSQNYNFTNRLNALVIQGQSLNTEALVELFTGSGDGTDELELRVYAVGKSDNINDSEFFQFGYAPIPKTFDIETKALGTGKARDIQIIDNGTTWMRFLAGAGVSISRTLNVTNVNISSDLNVIGNVNITSDLISPTIYDVSSQGLVLAMNFNNGSITGSTVLDSSGENNHGTNNGATHNATDGFDNLLSGAFDFDGVDDYIEILDSGSLDITDAITIVAWINADTFGSFERIVDKKVNEWTFVLTDTSPFTGLEFWINGVVRATTSTGELTADTWHFVVATYDKDLGGTEEVKIYIDGVSKATGDFSTAIGTNADSVDIGRETTGEAGKYFDGTIDEVSVWNRALSSDEVKRLYLQRVEFYNSYVSQRDIFVNASGSVGIGTSSPSAKLHIDSSTTNEVARFVSTDALAHLRVEDNSGHVLYSSSGDDSRIYTGDDDNTQKLTIKATSGNVGIGTTTPNYLLEIADTSGEGLSLNVSEVLFVNGSSNSVGIGTASPIGRFTIKQGSDNFLEGLTIVDSGSTDRWDLALAGNDLFFGFNSATKVFFGDDGKVGIGTTVPEATLDVESSGTNSQSIIRGRSDNGVRYLLATDLLDDGYMFLYDSGEIAQTAFRTNSNPSYIAGGGSFGIGTSTPAYKLQIQNSSEALNVSNFLFVNGSGVGIGTARPQVELHVIGDVNITGTDNNMQLGCGNITGEDTELCTLSQQFGDATANITTLNLTSQGQFDANAVYIGLATANISANAIVVGDATSNISNRMNVSGGNFNGAVKIDGSADVEQFIVQGHSTQSANLFVAEDSAGTNMLSVNNAGNTFIRGTLDIRGSLSDGAGNVIIADSLDITGTNSDLTLNQDGTGARSNNLILIDDTNTWWTRISGNQYHIRDNTAGTEPFRIDEGASTGTLSLQADGDVTMTQGNVGIGTSSPGTQLELESNNPQILLDDNTADNIYIGNVNADFEIRDTGNSNVLFVIEQAGDVGIGTTDPIQLLHIEDAAGSDTELLIRAGTAVASVGNDAILTLNAIANNAAQDQVRFRAIHTGGENVNFVIEQDTSAGALTEVLRIDTDGDVGIGTSSPSEVLEVEKNQNDFTVLRVENTNTGTGGRTGVTIVSGSVSTFIESVQSSNTVVSGWADSTVLTSDADMYIGPFGGTDKIFFQTGSVAGTRMTILDTGNVGIGTLSPPYELTVGDGQTFLQDGTGAFPLIIHRNANSANFGVVIQFSLNNSNNALQEYAELLGILRLSTAGSEDGDLVIRGMNDGTMRSIANFTGDDESLYMSGNIILGGGRIDICDGICDPDAATGDGDLYVEGNLEVDGSICIEGSTGGPCTESLGNLQVEDGSICVGNAGCDPGTDGTILIEGDFTSSDTGDLGWSVQTGANTACTATCTNACVFGFDDGVDTVVSCSSTAADTCVCAGAS